MTRLEEVRSLIDLALTAKASGVPCARLDVALQFAQERLGDALVASASALDVAPEAPPLARVDLASLRDGDRVLLPVRVATALDADGDVTAETAAGRVLYFREADLALRDPRQPAPQPGAPPALEPVDVAALRPGDRVLVALLVEEAIDGDGDVRATKGGGYATYISNAGDEVLRDPRPQPTS